MLYFSVDDTMDSILDWYQQGGRDFQRRFGFGRKLVQDSFGEEQLAGCGTASGPCLS